MLLSCLICRIPKASLSATYHFCRAASLSAYRVYLRLIFDDAWYIVNGYICR